ncbi:MAG: M20/M25/M40 family metallo-hydrolase [Planctomycetes bacterium]|nr:M20/M25/M40 family metallo-hydrolase [Planctomycetota bacterium]
MPRSRSLLALTAALAAACQSPHPVVAAAVAAVDPNRIMAHVEALCADGPRPGDDPVATERTLVYLENELRSYGYEPVRKPFGAWMMVTEKVEGGYRGHSEQVVAENLIAVHRGVDHPEQIVELGTHYDTVPWSPGADDNTSGVAAALECARAIAAVKTGKTIRIVFFALEENGKLGSREYVKQLAEDDRPEGMLSMDAIGFTNKAEGSQESPVRIPFFFWPPTVGDFLVIAGNWSSTWLASLHEGCIAMYVPELPYFSVKRIAHWFDDSSRGDHYEYWQAGIPSVALVDMPYSRGPHYHAATDTPDTLDPEFLWRNTQAITATMLEWADVRGANPEPR